MHSNGIGLHVNSTESIRDSQKYELLLNPFQPSADYDFKADSNGPRSFRYDWINTGDYAPWLVYSPHLKGALCELLCSFSATSQPGVFKGRL